MKKIVSIAAVAIMAFGLTTFGFENRMNDLENSKISTTIEASSDYNRAITCGGCSSQDDRRDPPYGKA